MIVDAHHHLWDTSHRTYPFLGAETMTPVRRPYTVDDLRAVTGGRVDRTVLVQTVGDVDETAEFLAAAHGSDGLIAGVVGWVDLTAPDVAERIARLRELPGGDRLVGIRHQVQDEPDLRWLDRPEVRRGIRAVGAAGLAYDLLVLTPQLPSARSVAEDLPEIRFVLDHLAKPGIAGQQWDPWDAGISALGALPNVTAKLSGLVTEARWDGWKPDDFRRYADHALLVFGPDRLMFGSDWPVCLLAAGYGEVFDLAQELTAGLDAAERAAVFGGTAVRTYQLPEPPGAIAP
ncbi:amidohydrolase family protein [Rugosimonospora africana]|uniref:Amidohydrolase n=1 Tax=Rugosimonospora africana TaxID=556532 RepID=A0A8J3R2H9_9ACTN|nr:amidohydrolase family protein [Rugosimonospora africana]GIH21061.1 amidohydrolase [Rugosimonospora africana]